MKGRSQSSNLSQPMTGGNLATQPSSQQVINQNNMVGTGGAGGQYPFINAQFFHRKQLMNSSGNASSSHHSHSQQVLDNSQAIQQKINMYSNMATAKKQQHQQVQQSPIGVKNGKASGSNASSKIVPAQLSRAFLQQRQNQTPNPSMQPMQAQLQRGHQNNFMLGTGEQRNIAGNMAAYGSQAQLANTQNNNQPASYYDLGAAMPTNAKQLGHQYQSAQNLEQIPRTTSQKIQSTSQSGIAKQNHQQQPIVQIKGVKSNRNNHHTGYGAGNSTLTNRQKSQKQAREHSANTLYSQISLKEIQSPVKQYKLASKVNIQKITQANFYGQQRATTNNSAQGQHESGGKSNKFGHQQMTQQIVGSNSAQAFVQYTQQHHTSGAAGESYVAEIQQIIGNMGHVDDASAGATGQGSQLAQGSRSRNITNVVTTNGVTTNHNQGSHASQGAILNINTASDINIYNNSFIVQSSPSHSQAQLPASNTTVLNNNKPSVSNNSTNRVNKRHQTQQNKTSGASQSSTHRVGTGTKINGRSSGSVNQVPTSSQGQTVNGNHRSMSTGRNHKSAHGSRGINAGKQHNANGTQILHTTNSNNNNGGQSKTTRAHAMNEAYKQNRSYVINNQPMLQQTTQQWQSSNQQVQHQQPGGPGQNNLISVPQNNNVAQVMLNFKNVRKNREAFNTQPIVDLGQNGPAAPGQLTNTKAVKSSITKAAAGKQSQQMLSQQDRVSELINKGRAKIKSKEFNDAIKIFTEILEKVDQTNADAIFYRAISYLDQGNLQQAISELWRVVELQKTSTTQMVQPVDVASSTTTQHLIELSQQAYVLLSIAHKRLGEVQNAIQDLEQCIEKFPQYPDSYMARGQTLLHQEEFTLALADFQKFLTLNKNSFSGYLGVGDCYKALKNFTEATQAYTKAIKLLDKQQNKPNYEQLFQQCYMKRGLSGYHDGKFQQSLTDLQCVIEKDTSNVKAHFYLGKILAKGIENQQSKQTDAILHFEQVAKYPDQEFYCGNALFQIAKLRLRQKDYYEAFHCLKRAADNNFTSKRLTMYKDFTEGVIYLIKRKIKKGVQILSDLLEILINKDKDDLKKKIEEGQKTDAANNKQTVTTIETKQKRIANKVHQDYLIHQILLFRAYGYVAIEKYEIAQDDIRKVDKYGEIDAATIYNKWLGKGILRMDHEDYLMASKFFAKAWKKYPSNKDPYCLQVISIVRSYSYSLGGYNIDQSIKFEKVLETKKFMDKAINNCCPRQKEPSLYFFRGLLNFQMHNFYEALADFNRAIDAEEDSSAYFFLARGRTYACLSILTEAMKDLSVALNLDETLQQAYIYRGKCAYLIGDNNLAFLDFQRLILTDPKNPMVHVYAGNLLMTTGAYQDAIKAYENADTVEPTTISSFQRVRCFCALSDLENAKNLLDNTKKLQPDDLILKFDGICLDELIKVSQITQIFVVKTSSKLTPADVKQSDQVLSQAILTFDELVNTYESDRLLQLKRRDSVLNVQIIPNVEKIKIEKALVAQDFHQQKQQLPADQQADLPSLSIDLDEPINTQNLKRLKSHSYYYENIFNLEDFYLYRGVFKFYSGRYEDALLDFDRARQASKDTQQQNARDNHPNSRGHSGLNTKNPTLQHFTMGANGTVGGRGSNENTLQSNMTDLSDIGLSSFNELEILFNVYLCHYMLNDRVNALNKLNELQRKTPKKYVHQIPLLRIITLQHFDETDKVKVELTKLKKSDPDLYSSVFLGSNVQRPFLIEPFPSEGRLCAKFTPQTLQFKNATGILANAKVQIRLSFSMPFIKPPNMIPNVDEESIQSEFNLKQIDAPMPEAPWIKRCAHGINFTNHITKDGKDKDKYRKFFQEKVESKKNITSKKASQLRNIQSQSNLSQTNTTLLSAQARLLDNMVGEEVSDRHKISLVEDNSPRIVHEEDQCKQDQCPANKETKLELNQNYILDDDADQISNSRHSDQVQVRNNPNNESEESYDSEEILERGVNGVMAIRDSSGLIQQERDSMVNMGENMARDNMRELRKMRKEIVNPRLGSNHNLAVKDLLPKVQLNSNEESKIAVVGAGANKKLAAASNKRTAKERYANFDDSAEEINVGSGILLPESQMQSARQLHGGKLTTSQQLAQATRGEPHRLNERMLAGDSQIRRQRERRVSNLSIGELEAENTTTPNKVLVPQQKTIDKSATKGAKTEEEKKANGERRSLFRTSIADDSI